MIAVKESDDKYRRCLSCGKSCNVFRIEIGMEQNQIFAVCLCYDCVELLKINIKDIVV